MNATSLSLPLQVNFWMPLTSIELTQTTLWVESSPAAAGLGSQKTTLSMCKRLEFG